MIARMLERWPWVILDAEIFSQRKKSGHMMVKMGRRLARRHCRGTDVSRLKEKKMVWEMGIEFLYARRAGAHDAWRKCCGARRISSGVVGLSSTGSCSPAGGDRERRWPAGVTYRPALSRCGFRGRVLRRRERATQTNGSWQTYADNVYNVDTAHHGSIEGIG
ncbi:hypothetical protein ABW21_db0201907 [Orbilia brochopaga]|nr:hypothetical protein ABW21_db0201907 [Drechslerella brochopaga]